MKTIKTLYHLAMVVAAVCEYRQSQSFPRKQLCGGFAGFHLASVIIDALDEET